MLKKYSLSKYIAEEEWQKNILLKAKKFITNPSGCFYIGGQPGSGKTHICTAIVNSLIREGNAARYMLWREASVEIKGIITESEPYFEAVNVYKKAPVLYIDDFLRNRREWPTNADINLALEIINYRYNNNELITLISSERSIDEICDIDTALGSRIMEMAKENCITVEPDNNKNYRLKVFSNYSESDK